MSSAREWTALLSCGSRLTYESRSLAPSVGETVPCRRHGYCSVDRVDSHSEKHPLSTPSRARPRTHRELVEYVSEAPSRSLSTLRQHRFSLRMVRAAERVGDIILNESSGDVTVSVPSWNGRRSDGRSEPRPGRNSA